MSTGFTRFVQPQSVEVWDASFRWRSRGALRDRTVDDTWRRVAGAVAAVEGSAAPVWTARFVDAFATWRLLPDERLLRDAGTASALEAGSAPVAVIGVPAFVRGVGDAGARLDITGLRGTAELAVRLLDDALAAGLPCSDPGLRIGVVGMADALAQLGAGYGGDAARRHAAEVAAAIAEGALQGAVRLAAERGASHEDTRPLAARWRARGMSAELIADALRWGVRHAQLTGIDSQPRLALFANTACDALDPPMSSPPGAAARTAVDDIAPEASLVAQLELRAAVQPWIDAPIDYPLLAATAPETAARTACATASRQLGLRLPQWQTVGRTQPALPM